jgi:hypothetical protein
MDVERQWLASRVRLLDTFDPRTSKRSWVSESTIPYVRVILLQDDDVVEQAKGHYKLEICPEYQIPSDFDDLRLQLLFNANRDYYSRNGQAQSFQTLFNTLSGHLEAKVRIYVSASHILMIRCSSRRSRSSSSWRRSRHPLSLQVLCRWRRCCSRRGSSQSQRLHNSSPYRLRKPLQAQSSSPHSRCPLP